VNNGAHGTAGVPIDLAGRVALVTGAGSGIGEAIAGILARAGALVAVADLSEPAAVRVAGEITALGGRAIAVRLDVADEASVRDGVGRITTELGPVRIVVNNAATWTIKPFADTSPAEIERVFAVTVTGAMNVTRSVLTDLCAEPGGRVVNIISDSGRVGEAHMAAYASAKAALVGFTKSLAREVGRQGVTVNGVSPGTTVTPGSADFIAQVGGEQKLARAYPLGRLGRPEDIAGAVLFFASPLADWITGQVLSVSGGFTMV
jgi:NAD(P)-dependent dehydrogenase (short-subunit alcohol dehydrogenase family)